MHLIWSLQFFFDFEVIFHMLFQFGTEESAGCGQIHRNNSALVLNRHPIEPHKYLIWPHGAVIEPYIRSYEVSMRFYEISIKYQSWVVSVNLSTSSRFFCTKLKLHVEDDLEIKKKLQGLNQVHKWSLHAKIWVLEMKNKEKCWLMANRSAPQLWDLTPWW